MESRGGKRSEPPNPPYRSLNPQPPSPKPQAPTPNPRPPTPLSEPPNPPFRSRDAAAPSRQRAKPQGGGRGGVGGQMLPDPVPGEFPLAGYTVEVKSYLGTLSVPRSTRADLTFLIGDGERDSTMRFSATDVGTLRTALAGMRYHTPLDGSVQYLNSQYALKCNNSSPIFDYKKCKFATKSACSRTCFLSDLGGSAFSLDTEPTGCDQGCGKAIVKVCTLLLLPPSSPPRCDQGCGQEPSSAALTTYLTTECDQGCGQEPSSAALTTHLTTSASGVGKSRRPPL